MPPAAEPRDHDDLVTLDPRLALPTAGRGWGAKGTRARHRRRRSPAGRRGGRRLTKQKPRHPAGPTSLSAVAARRAARRAGGAARRRRNDRVAERPRCHRSGLRTQRKLRSSRGNRRKQVSPSAELALDLAMVSTLGRAGPITRGKLCRSAGRARPAAGREGLSRPSSPRCRAGSVPPCADAEALERRSAAARCARQRKCRAVHAKRAAHTRGRACRRPPSGSRRCRSTRGRAVVLPCPRPDNWSGCRCSRLCCGESRGGQRITWKRAQQVQCPSLAAPAKRRKGERHRQGSSAPPAGQRLMQRAERREIAAASREATGCSMPPAQAP